MLVRGRGEALVKDLDRPRVTDDLLVIFNRFAGDAQPLRQHKMGVAQGQRVAFNGGGGVGPQVAELV